jgi:hypothetical protein
LKRAANENAHARFLFRLADVLADDGRQVDPQQREPQVGVNYFRGEHLAGAGWPGKQGAKPRARRQAFQADTLAGIFSLEGLWTRDK